MTLELDVDPIYVEMLEKIEEEAPGDPRADLATIVESEIHNSYQQMKSEQE